MEDHKVEQWTCGDYNNCESDIKTTRSGPDIRLTELEQQLEVAETRCGSLKSQLDYMKMLYQGVQPCSTEFVQAADELAETQPSDTIRSSPREAAVKMLVEEKESRQENTTTSIEDVKYYQFLKQIHKMQEITKEYDSDLEETFTQQSPRSRNITPRLFERHPAVLEENEEEGESISAERRRTKQIRKTHVVLESAVEPAPEPVSILASVTAAGTCLRIPEITQVGNKYDIDDATEYQRPANCSARLQNDSTTSKNLSSRFSSENKSEYGGNERRKETRKQELVLKLSDSMDGAPITVKRKRVTKVDKKQRSGLCAGTFGKKTPNPKYDDALSVASNNKSKRKKGKLRSAGSRNTVTNKETNLSERRDTKKRKQKGYSSATHMPRRLQPPGQLLTGTKAEVVEIYHNNAVEGGSGSISVSSSKHSKQQGADQPRNNNILLRIDGPEQMCSAVAYQQQQQQQSRIPDQKALQEEIAASATFDENNDEGLQKYSSRSQKSQNCAIQDSNREETQCRSAPQPSRYYDTTITRNYELPTVASKLKKVNRSYFNRFNFRNIPFVVSTSVTPSHNLGLNIQQVLSIMKTRQPMATGMAPLLIRKMSKGVRPASALLDCSNDASYSPKSPKSTILSRQSNLVSWERPKTTGECSASIDETVKSKYTRYLTAQTGRLQLIPSMHTNSDAKSSLNPLLDREEEMPAEMNWVEQQESGCVCCSKKSQSYNKMLKQYTSRKSITGNPGLTASALLRERQEEINIGDNQYNRSENVSGNAKGIREVLINLHDQFEELNMAYEKLQEQAANSITDKSITKQIAALEKELNDKEEEINAVVGLYKEVLNLKQQVNSIHGKNSFVCITRSDDQSSPAMIPRSGNMRTQLMMNPMQIFGMRNKSFSANAREPATATRLTGLLREIQSFQKQLLAL